MRQTLLFGGLKIFQRNINRRNYDLKLYDSAIATIIILIKKEGEYCGIFQDFHLGMWLSGVKLVSRGRLQQQKTIVYELNEYIENIFSSSGRVPSQL
jgi:phenylalanyl-tRNA synthetase beta chain